MKESAIKILEENEPTKENSLDRLRNFYGGKMDDEMKEALKNMIAENTLANKDGVLPINY